MMFSAPNDPVSEDKKSDAKDNCSHCAGRKKVSHAAEHQVALFSNTSLDTITDRFQTSSAEVV